MWPHSTHACLLPSCSRVQVLYADVHMQHWDADQQQQAAAAVDASARAAAEGAEEEQGAAGPVDDTLLLPADPAVPPDALDAEVGSAAAARRHQRRQREQRLYFDLQRATGPPLSIDVQRALEVGADARVEVLFDK